MTVLYHAARVTLGLIFLTALLKLQARGEFEYTLSVLTEGSPVQSLTSVMAWLVISIEAILGGLLMIHRWVKPAVIGIAGLLTVFLIVLPVLSAKGRNCNCFGTWESDWHHAGILRNVGLLGLCAMTWRCQPKR